MELSKSIYLRSEVNNTETRTILIPSDIIELIKDGWVCYVEKSPNRIYPDKLYSDSLCELTDLPWYHEKFSSSLIIGLKQFDHIDKLYTHTHIYFSHSYQSQLGSKQLLEHFAKSGSILYDLEYFLNPNNSRLVSFGFWAGIVGCGLGLLEYTNERIYIPSINNLKYWDNSNLFIGEIKNKLNLLDKETKSNIQIGLLGPRGNCGMGVQSLLDKLGLPFVPIDRFTDKTKLFEFDILINCIKLNPESNETWFDSNTPFYKPIIIVDISCDYTKPNNPIKLYDKKTTWSNPVFKPNQFVKIISIDNLPSLLPKSSSDYFSNLFVKLLKDYSNDNNKIWERNLNIYKNMIS
jgi:saccharopine dehydrogenase (NAD+, L-lysine-forming)